MMNPFEELEDAISDLITNAKDELEKAGSDIQRTADIAGRDISRESKSFGAWWYDKVLGGDAASDAEEKAEAKYWSDQRSQYYQDHSLTAEQRDLIDQLYSGNLDESHQQQLACAYAEALTVELQKRRSAGASWSEIATSFDEIADGSIEAAVKNWSQRTGIRVLDDHRSPEQLAASWQVLHSNADGQTTEGMYLTLGRGSLDDSEAPVVDGAGNGERNTSEQSPTRKRRSPPWETGPSPDGSDEDAGPSKDKSRRPSEGASAKEGDASRNGGGRPGPSAPPPKEGRELLKELREDPAFRRSERDAVIPSQIKTFVVEHLRSYVKTKVKSGIAESVPYGKGVVKGMEVLADLLTTTQSLQSKETLEKHPGAKPVVDAKNLGQPDQWIARFGDGSVTNLARQKAQEGYAVWQNEYGQWFYEKGANVMPGEYQRRFDPDGKGSWKETEGTAKPKSVGDGAIIREYVRKITGTGDRPVKGAPLTEGEGSTNRC